MLWVVAMALCGVFCYQGLPAMALELILSFKAYLRPGEADRLCVKNLVAPVASAGPQYQRWGLWLYPRENLVPGKTGLFDEAIPLDDAVCHSLYEFWWVLTANRHREEPLWPHSSHEFNAALSEGSALLQL